ncbi:MAG: hypothetical protein AB1898_32695 [Acidobacteriota bacterium]
MRVKVCSRSLIRGTGRFWVWVVGVTMGLSLVCAGQAASSKTKSDQRKTQANSEVKGPQAKAIVQIEASKPPLREPLLRGQHAFVDPQTGKLREAELEEIQTLMNQVATGRSRGPLRQFRLPNGAVAVELDASYCDFLTATVNANGSVTMTCSKGHDHSRPASSATSGKEVLDVQ